MDKEKFDMLRGMQQQLQGYHGTTKIQNVSEFASSVLFQNFFSEIHVSLDLTVHTVMQRINDILSSESILLQFGNFQKQTRKKDIIPSQKMPGNQRVSFYQGKTLHEWLQMIFSPQEYYFTVNPASFKKGDKQHNRGVFQHAVDAVVIDPEMVAESSLDALGIVLDPDCQNLKDIFKKMRPLNYQYGEDKKHTIRINEYEGKYIVLAAHKVVFDASQPATKGEQRKEDVSSHMSVYPDIFSLIRREEYIVDSTQEKQQEYQEIKKKLISSLKEITWNTKQYSMRVQQNIQEIIAEIDGATSAKIMADKLYHLYKITGKHSENDKKLLEASMRSFTKRIGQLIGISSATQLHLLELNDVLEDQSLDIQSFHARVSVALYESSPQKQADLFLLHCETYYAALKKYTALKQPFLSFSQQIKRLCGNTIQDVKRSIPVSLPKIQEVIDLQKRVLAGYMLEHELNLNEKSIQEVANLLNDIHPGFSVDMTKAQRDSFFDDLKNLSVLDREVDEIVARK